MSEHTAEKDAGRVRPSVLRQVISEAMDRAEAAGMDRRTTEEWISIEILGSSLIPLTTDAPPQMTEAEYAEVERSSWFQQEYERSKKRNKALGAHGMVVTGTGLDVPTRVKPPEGGRAPFAMDADLTVYWPWVRPCWEER